VAPSKNLPLPSTDISHFFLAIFSPSTPYQPYFPWQAMCSNVSFLIPQAPSHQNYLLPSHSCHGYDHVTLSLPSLFWKGSHSGSRCEGSICRQGLLQGAPSLFALACTPTPMYSHCRSQPLPQKPSKSSNSHTNPSTPGTAPLHFSECYPAMTQQPLTPPTPPIPLCPLAATDDYNDVQPPSPKKCTVNIAVNLPALWPTSYSQFLRH
jgi:hypothetical protein